jgi:copper(I)-binding protein
MTGSKFLSLMLMAVVMTVGIFAHSGQGFSAEKNEMVVKDAWSRARPAGALIGVAFLTIHNEGKNADKLIEVSSPVAKRVEIHESFMKDGVMSMAPKDTLDIKAGEKLMLEPGSYHIMLKGLNEDLREGREFPLTLSFEKAGDIRVIAHVKEAGAMSAGHMH